ncbi:hypothetical protein QT882_01505, partial [Xanthomonas fragariae]|uniref:hypothetical protein n=3 Tax=Xanthomonas fragariae TaxID=48664 RepID=UPI0025A025EA
PGSCRSDRFFGASAESAPIRKDREQALSQRHRFKNRPLRASAGVFFGLRRSMQAMAPSKKAEEAEKRRKQVERTSGASKKLKI